MLRSAAKNHDDVLVVVDPDDYSRVLEAVTGNTVTPALRRELAMKVFQHTSRYDGLIAGYLEKHANGGRSSSRKYCRFSLSWRNPSATERILTSKARSIVNWTARSHRFLVGRSCTAKRCLTITSLMRTPLSS